MRLKTVSMAAAAAALVAAPVAIQAQAADRASAPAEGASELAGGDGVYAIIAVAVLAAFIALTAANDDDLPTSP